METDIIDIITQLANISMPVVLVLSGLWFAFYRAWPFVTGPLWDAWRDRQQQELALRERALSISEEWARLFHAVADRIEVSIRQQ